MCTIEEMLLGLQGTPETREKGRNILASLFLSLQSAPRPWQSTRNQLTGEPGISNLRHQYFFSLIQSRANKKQHMVNHFFNDYLNYSCVAVVVGYLFKCAHYFNIFLSVNHFWKILIYNYSILFQTYKVFHYKLTCCPLSFLYFAFVFFHLF